MENQDAIKENNPSQESIYFGDEEEKLFIKYIESKNDVERNIIFWRLRPTLVTMIDALIKKYTLFVPGEDINTTIDDALTNLVDKASKYNKEKGRAYSYLGTITKRYIMHRRIKAMDHEKKSDFDVVELKSDDEFEDKIDDNRVYTKKLFDTTTEFIEYMCDHPDNYSLNENEIKVGKSLASIMRNIDTVFTESGTNKFNKSSVIFMIGEQNLMSSEEVKKHLKKIKNWYGMVKKCI